MKIKELIEYGKNLLKENEIEDSAIISRILTEYILNMNRQTVIANLEKEVEEKFEKMYYLALIKIIEGMPIQYITGKQEFMKLLFNINKDVLIPQPDTEILVEEVIKIAKQNKKSNILDICTGSGCIGISLSYYIESSKVVLADISKEALIIAKRNIEQNLKNNKNQIKIIQTDMFENITEKFDIIVSNPPYIESEEIQKLEKQVQNEPRLSLDGGKDGLKFYKILVNEAYKYLNENGYLCMEIGYNQKEAVTKLLEESKYYKEIYTKKDLVGNDRIVVAKKIKNRRK